LTSRRDRYRDGEWKISSGNAASKLAVLVHITNQMSIILVYHILPRYSYDYV